MEVREIANGSEVRIHAAISGHSIVIMTEAIFGVSEGLLVKPMEYFGKYMQFLEPSNVTIRNKRDGRVYKFMSTTITPVRTRYGNFHLIRSSSKLEPENSRKAERFYIEKLGLMSVNGNRNDLKNCIVYDISMRGMALIIDDSTTLKPGDSVDVMFRYGSTLHNYEVSTIVVRNFKVKDKKAVGCSIANINVDLIGLLATKRNEAAVTNLDEAPETNLNPQISENQQIQEINEDLAGDTMPKRPATITISSKPQGMSDSPKDSAPAPDTVQAMPKEERLSKESLDMEKLLDLSDI